MRKFIQQFRDEESGAAMVEHPQKEYRE